MTTTNDLPVALETHVTRRRYSNEAVTAALTAINGGASLSEAALEAAAVDGRLPDKATVWYWVQTNEQAFNAFSLSKRRQAVKIAHDVFQAAAGRALEELPNIKGFQTFLAMGIAKDTTRVVSDMVTPTSHGERRNFGPIVIVTQPSKVEVHETIDTIPR